MTKIEKYGIIVVIAVITGMLLAIMEATAIEFVFVMVVEFAGLVMFLEGDKNK